MYAYYIITLYAISPSDQSYWDNQQFTHWLYPILDNGVPHCEESNKHSNTRTALSLLSLLSLLCIYIYIITIYIYIYICAIYLYDIS